MNGFQSVINDIRNESDPLSKVLLLIEGLSTVFDNNE